MRRAAIVLGLALAAAGCADGPSLVVVDVTSDAPVDGVATLAVQVSAGGKNASYTLAPPAGAFSADAAAQSFGIDLPRGMTGTVTVSVDASDAMGNVLASGSASTTIKKSARVDLPLVLAVAGATGSDLGDTPDMGGGGDLALPSSGPALAGDRASQKFGSVTVGKTSNSVMIKVTNGGDMPSGTLAFSTSGANLDQFTLTNGCSGTLAAGASCTVTAQFAPTSAGDKAAHFEVSASPGGTVAVDVSGTGTPPGTLTISADAPYNGDCGSAVVGQTSTTFATYTVTNVGTSTSGSMTVSTGDPQFIATGCTGTLDPGLTCTITVHVKPANGGMLTSSVQVTANPGGTAPANVQGHGLNPAAFKITSPSGFSFGTAQRNSAGNVITFTATNTGDVTSNPLAHASTGATPTSFPITDESTCYTHAIAPNGTCTVQVEFKPLVSGANNATLTINDAGGVLGMANISGTGTPIWVQETLPLPSGATAVPTLTVVFGSPSDGSHVYVAGGATYYERDATGTWSVYTMNPAGVTPAAVGAGWALGVNNVFLATDVGVLRSTAPTAWSAPYEPLNGVQGLVAFSASDGWAATNGGTTITTHRLTASGWAVDNTITGSGNTVTGRTALWGTSDNDLWLGGWTKIGTVNTAVVWKHDASGWSAPVGTAPGCGSCIGGVVPTVVGLWGFGTPATTLFSIARPVSPAMWTSAGGWVTLANVPLGMGGSGKSCGGLWGSSPTAMWYACDGGMFLYDGGGTWDANGQLNVSGFRAVWGSGPNDVYAVGADASDAGFVYHYY